MRDKVRYTSNRILTLGIVAIILMFAHAQLGVSEPRKSKLGRVRILGGFNYLSAPKMLQEKRHWHDINVLDSSLNWIR